MTSTSATTVPAIKPTPGQEASSAKEGVFFESLGCPAVRPCHQRYNFHLWLLSQMLLRFRFLPFFCVTIFRIKVTCQSKCPIVMDVVLSVVTPLVVLRRPSRCIVIDLDRGQDLASKFNYVGHEWLQRHTRDGLDIRVSRRDWLYHIFVSWPAPICVFQGIKKATGLTNISAIRGKGSFWRKDVPAI